MKNIFKNLIIILFFILIYIKKTALTTSIINSIDIFKSKLFPSIFPIMIISDLIMSSNIINIISQSIGQFFSKLFKTSKYSAYIFIMSSFSGCPSNAKYIKDLLNNDVIDKNEAVKILSMTMLYNPLLIISISPLNYHDTIYLLIINTISNIIIGIINRNQNISYKEVNLKKKNFNLINSISLSMNALILILGSVTTFNAINSLIPYKHPLISGIFEITNGINMIKDISPYKYKFIFTSILLSFGGLSILYQIKSILKDTNLNYTLFYKSRIIHLIIMLILTYIII